MRTAVCLIAYNAPRFIQDVLVPFQGHLKIYSYLGTSPWGKYEQHSSKEAVEFNKLASDLSDDTVISWWASEADQRNEALKDLQEKGFDYVWFVDADEIFTSNHIPYALTFVARHPEIDCWYIKHDVYWKTPEYRLEIDHLHGGIHIVKSSFRFKARRDYDPTKHKAAFIPPEMVTCKHMSYVRTDEEMLEKVTTFDHKNEVRPDWFEKVWLAWTPEMIHLHPIRAEEFKRAVKEEKCAKLAS